MPQALVVWCVSGGSGAQGYLNAVSEQHARGLAQDLVQWLDQSLGVPGLFPNGERAESLQSNLKFKLFKSPEQFAQARALAIEHYSQVLLLSSPAPHCLQSIQFISEETALPVVVSPHLHSPPWLADSPTLQEVTHWRKTWEKELLENYSEPHPKVLVVQIDALFYLSLWSSLEFTSSALQTEPSHILRIKEALQNSNLQPLVIPMGVQWENLSPCRWIWDHPEEI
jgi:hypothetical protein